MTPRHPSYRELKAAIERDDSRAEARRQAAAKRRAQEAIRRRSESLAHLPAPPPGWRIEPPDDV